jgi:hypothetical protein
MNTIVFQESNFHYTSFLAYTDNIPSRDVIC